MSTQNRNWKRHITKALTILLFFMVFLSIIQWFIIQALFGFGTEMLKDGMVRQAPDGVNREFIVNTFERVKMRFTQLPFSFITGQLDLRKLKAAGEYAIVANEDETWEADEINNLLQILNASVGFKQETE
ncbi:hypothetical protein C6497_08065 [Candidatus Poribacteria bacterium]|nr:MAG: hypothetical protein C6497_08065 [Candidatus Poribacteria bacterium]